MTEIADRPHFFNVIDDHAGQALLTSCNDKKTVAYFEQNDVRQMLMLHERSDSVFAQPIDPDAIFDGRNGRSELSHIEQIALMSATPRSIEASTSEDVVDPNQCASALLSDSARRSPVKAER